MWLLQQVTITQETLLLALLLGFLLLAGLCLSARVFTQLLELIVKRGSSEAVRKRERQRAQTTSLRETGNGSSSAQMGDGRSTSDKRDTS